MSDYFIFGNIDTRNYEGISVYFDEVDTTPKRVGEFIEIPNRNGSLFLDSGRYEDVPHTYDIIALSFQNGRNLINALASKVGHHRLEDSFNTGEYYSAVFDTEVSPTVTMERDKFSFKVMFTRKPQRWLTSGETAVTVANNGTLTNPTLFDASPMLEVEGYGTIAFNGHEIEIADVVMGEVEIGSAKTFGLYNPFYYVITVAQKASYNTGDTLSMLQSVFSFSLHTSQYDSDYVIASATATDSNSAFSTEFVNTTASYAYFKTSISPLSFTAGTDATFTDTITISATMRDSSTKTFTVGIKVSYEAEGSYSQSYFDVKIDDTSLPQYYFARKESGSSCAGIIADSTVSILGHPTYIDCDLGEAYMIKNGTPISLNQYIDLGSDLPKLASGTNTFTKSNTVTQLKVTPRWWKV